MQYAPVLQTRHDAIFSSCAHAQCAESIHENNDETRGAIGAISKRYKETQMSNNIVTYY